MQLSNRSRNIIEKHNMEHNRTECHISCQNKISRKDDNNDYPNLLNKIFCSIKNETQLTGLHLIFRHLKLNRILSFKFMGLAYKRLYDGHRFNECDDGIAFIFAM